MNCIKTENHQYSKKNKDEKCFCTWECAQLNSTVYTFRGILNMFKQSFKVLNRRRLMKKLGSDMSFENYKNTFLKTLSQLKILINTFILWLMKVIR